VDELARSGVIVDQMTLIGLYLARAELDRRT
jgi:hypothetical protein